MKIYTRTGDKGITSLAGGTRVSKDDPQIEAYGTIDELLSWIGLVRDQEASREHQVFLLDIMDRLMTCATILALDKNHSREKMPFIVEQDILELEKEIDRMESVLAPLQSFILPGGHTSVSYCHISRTICRRAERSVLKVKVTLQNKDMVEKYLNRLSDYLFVLSRSLAYYLKTQEMPWKPRV
ncbi:MAG: cob(I)yrinic acid a,c-diamide adenosyltransferase [Bacteroidota bacterium]|nr:cob(I)yrinic acid a,c-diamide adenosyltransferase [Bacteroidota bacterium]